MDKRKQHGNGCVICGYSGATCGSCFVSTVSFSISPRSEKTEEKTDGTTRAATNLMSTEIGIKFLSSCKKRD